MTGRPWSKTELMPCGTSAAHRRHERRGEPVDDACREAYNRDARTRSHDPSVKRATRARTAAIKALIDLHPEQFQRLQQAALDSLIERETGS